MHDPRAQRLIAPAPRLGWLLLAALIALAGCTNPRSAGHAGGDQGSAVPVPPARAARNPAAPAPDAGHAGAEKGELMTHIQSHETLPEGFDTRVTTLLAGPLPDDVLIAFYYVAAGKSPHPNYRWQLTRDGALFVVHHSGKNPNFEITFDRPLPEKPTERLDDGAVRALMAELDRADYFRQPAYQVDPRAEDGAYVIVRARRDGAVHDVVYHNVEGPLVQFLFGVTN